MFEHGAAGLEALEAATQVFAQQVEGRVLIVSGASGFIGGAVTREACSAGAAAVIGVGRRHAPTWWPQRAHWVTWDIGTDDSSNLDAAFAAVRADFPRAPVVVVHAASLTASSDLREKAGLVGQTIRNGTRNLLDWAQHQLPSAERPGRDSAPHTLEGRAEGPVFLNLSSMEAYGTFTFPQPTTVAEDEVGILDAVDPRSTYGIAKRESEEMCSQVATSTGVRVMSIRAGHVVGRWCPPNDPRAVAAFIRNARAGEDIVLRSAGTGILNVVDSSDLLDAMGVLIARGELGQVYTAVNSEQARTVREIAELVAGLAGSETTVRIEPVDRSVSGFAPPQSAVFSTERLRGLGWLPRHSLEQSIKATNAWWDSLQPRAAHVSGTTEG